MKQKEFGYGSLLCVLIVEILPWLLVLAAIFYLLVFVGCTRSNHWNLTAYDSATWLDSCSGWSACTPFPKVASGQTLNDLEWPLTSLTLGQTLSVPFEVTSTPGTAYAATNGETEPFRLTLMLDRAKDTTGDPTYRFYCTAYAGGEYVLGTADNTSQALTCPLESQYWSDVDGRQDQAAFEAVLSRLGSINVCFGGNGGLCHGLAVTGAATINVGEPAVQ